MEIKKVTIKNFRSIKEPVSLNFTDSYITLTGENNCGKSNILRALNLFFNDEVDPGIAFDSKKDMHVKTIEERGKEYTTISCVLALGAKRDRHVIQGLDNLVSNASIKSYDIDNLHLRLSITKSNRTQVQYVEPTTGTLTQNRGITDFFNNKLRRNVNFMYIPSIKDLTKFIDRDVNYELLRRIFNTWGRGRNPAARKLKTRFDEIRDNIKGIIDEASLNITEILKEQTDKESRFIFELPFEEVIDFLSALPISIDDGAVTDISQKGSGVQALTLYSILRYLDQYKPTNKYVRAQFIWAIEEPETFLHPNAQRYLYEALYTYSRNIQIIVTTHSYYFLNVDNYNGNYLLRIEPIMNTNYFHTTVSKETDDNWDIFVDILGDYKPSFVPTDDFKKIQLFVEGVIDIRYIERCLRCVPECKEFFESYINIQDGNGEEIVQRASDAKYLYKLKTLVLVDGDTKGDKYRRKLINKGFVFNENLFQVESDMFSSPTIEGLVTKDKIDGFKATMPEPAIEYWDSNTPRFERLWGDVEENAPEGWDTASCKKKLCDYIEEYGEESDFIGLIELLKNIKKTAEKLV